MIEFLRSFFRFGGSSKRVAVGRNAGITDIDIKHVEYIKESNARLNKLHALYQRYRLTPHAPKLKLVWEKTNRIHEYLISRNRVYELEIFHLQHTDHFISTYTLIIDVHQQHPDAATRPYHIPEAVTEGLFESLSHEKSRKRVNGTGRIEMVRPIKKETLFLPEAAQQQLTKLAAPAIAINTFTKIPYRIEESRNGLVHFEIGHTSTPQEKEAFLLYVTDHLGMKGVSYVGNALVNIPNEGGGSPSGLVPILHWAGFLYALNLNDFRLFPVSVQRKSP